MSMAPITWYGLIYDAPAGENISDVAKTMIAKAVMEGRRVKCMFNEIVLIIAPMSTVNEVVTNYHDQRCSRRWP